VNYDLCLSVFIRVQFKNFWLRLCRAKVSVSFVAK
jgi:hypothetical protein